MDIPKKSGVRFLSLQVRDYGPFAGKHEWQFGPRQTVIAGRSGSGLTTIARDLADLGPSPGVEANSGTKDARMHVEVCPPGPALRSSPSDRARRDRNPEPLGDRFLPQPVAVLSGQETRPSRRPVCARCCVGKSPRGREGPGAGHARVVRRLRDPTRRAPHVARSLAEPRRTELSGFRRVAGPR